MIFTRDFVIRENHWQIASLITHPKIVIHGNSCIYINFTDGFPLQRPVTLSFDLIFNLSLNQKFSKNGDAGDLRRHRTHYDVNLLIGLFMCSLSRPIT